VGAANLQLGVLLLQLLRQHSRVARSSSILQGQ
jgi:hypothetical protein